MDRAEILKQAEELITGNRQIMYGSPDESFEAIGYMWGVYLREVYPEITKVFAINQITAKDVAVMMALLKIVRAARDKRVYSEDSDYPDTYIDLAGYAALAGEIATKSGPHVVKATPPENRPVNVSPF